MTLKASSKWLYVSFSSQGLLGVAINPPEYGTLDQSFSADVVTRLQTMGLFINSKHLSSKL